LQKEFKYAMEIHPLMTFLTHVLQKIETIEFNQKNVLNYPFARRTEIYNGKPSF